MVLLIKMTSSKIRMPVLPGLPSPAPAYACRHGKIISNAPLHCQKYPVKCSKLQVTISKSHSTLMTAILPSFAFSGKYNCIGVGMQHND